MSHTSVAESANFGMNTEIIHKVFGEYAQEALIASKAELARLEQSLSRFLSGSEVSRINESAGVKPVKISNENYEVLSNAIRFSEISDGLFDITIGPLIDLWDYKHASEVPKEARIQQVLPLVNYSNLLLDPHEKTAKLRKPGQIIDLGGIGKGFASDRFIEVLKEFGITSAFTNIGGNVSTLGNKPDGSSWCVGIRHPRHEGCLLGAVWVIDKAVVTSGDYERYFIDREGERHHHILNPFTGYPTKSGLISVTIIADSAMTADALSTIVFAAGIEKGRELLAAYPGTEAVLVDNCQRVYITRGLKNCYQSTEYMDTDVI